MLSPAGLLLRGASRCLPLTRHVPFVIQRLALQQSLNRLFAVPLADGAFDVLRDRWLRLKVRDLQLEWFVTCSNAGLQVAVHAPAQVSISGDWSDFLLLASRQEDPDTLFFRRRLVIEGDTELGLEIKNLLDNLDPDDLPAWFWTLLQRLGQEQKLRTAS
ncbi:MAG: putative lipid carrier protein YhbT [Pseudomonas sp.]|jgi:predicted lipid carrier protein YhbT